MLIYSIMLDNFRQYKGSNFITFSTDSEKNVTVITGENTCGKTTLVQSFIWCFYGHVDFKDKRILNTEVAEKLKNNIIGAKETATVRVNLSHDGINYLIERKEITKVIEYNKLTTEQSFKIYEIDHYGNTIPLEVNDYDSIISDILPENLSDYFFFWGERIEKLSEKKELSEAIQQFLGMDTMAAAIKHLKIAVNRLTKEAGSTSNDADIEKYNKKVEELEKKIKEYDEQIISHEKNAQYYKDKADKLYAELTTSENKKLQDRQNEYKIKSGRLDTLKYDVEEAKKNFFKHFNDSKNYIYYFANLEEKKVIKLLKENPEPVIGWNYIDNNVITEIIKRGKCICGNEFCEGDTTYSYLIEQRKLVAPNTIGGVINSFVEGIERRESFNQNYYDVIHDDYKKISEYNDEIIDLEFEVENLRKSIVGKSDLRETDRRYHEALKNVNNHENLLGRLESEKNRCNDDINKYNKNIKVLMARNDKFYKQMRAINYAEKVRDVFMEDYDKNEKSLKAKLELYVNKNFQEVYSGSRKIEIDEKYNAIALNKVSEKWISSETSPGLETVKNFAFIAGLVQCAKEKIIGADGLETEANANSYPLVLDAPFSQADEKHVPAISKLISNNAEQIILVVMKKDWNYAKDVLNNKVGKKYTLEKMTETHTFVREEELHD